MTAIILPLAELGATALWLLYIWLASAIVASVLSRSKGYTEKVGLGTGMLLSLLGVIVWLIIPARKDAEWRARKPWQRRRKPTEADFAAAEAAAATPGPSAEGGGQTRPGPPRV